MTLSFREHFFQNREHRFLRRYVNFMEIGERQKYDLEVVRSIMELHDLRQHNPVYPIGREHMTVQ